MDGVTPCPDTPALGPDTPDMEFLVHIIFVIWASQSLKQGSHTLSLSLTAHSPSPPHVHSLPLPHELPLSSALECKSSLST